MSKPVPHNIKVSAVVISKNLATLYEQVKSGEVSNRTAGLLVSIAGKEIAALVLASMWAEPSSLPSEKTVEGERVN